MAKPRPGAEVTQVIDTTSPTLSNPALVPIVVGPCYEVVEALTSAGAIDTASQVVLPGSVIATGVGSTLSLSGKTFAVIVDSGVKQVYTFPTTPNDAAISKELTLSLLRAAFTGTITKFLDAAKTIITLQSAATGDSSSIEISSTDLSGTTLASPSYATIGFDSSDIDVTRRGASSYANAERWYPWANLPTNRAKSTDALTFDDDEMALYRSFAGGLKSVSSTSAVLQNSRSFMATSLSDTAVTVRSNLMETEQDIVAVSGIGATTNQFFVASKAASVVIPGEHGLGNTSSTKFPDVTGGNYLTVTAFGLQDFKLNQANAIGPYVGAAGNALDVTWATGAAAVAFAGTTLTITYGAGTTYQDITDAYAASTATSYVKLDVTAADMDSVFDSAQVYYNGAAPVDFNLGGGMNPLEFDGTAGTGDVTISGGVKFTDTTLAPFAGRTLSIRTSNQTEWIDVVLTSTVASTVAAINNAFGDTVADDASVPTAKRCVQPDGTRDGAVYTALVLSTTNTKYHDSSISVRADADVLEALFEGVFTGTDTITNSTATTHESGNHFNTAATTAEQIALVANAGTKVEYGSVNLHGYISSTQTLFSALTGDIVCTHSTLGASKTVTIGGGSTDPATLAGQISVQIGLGDLDGLVDCVAVDGQLTFVEATGVAGATFSVVTAGTDGDFVTEFANSVSDMLDTEAATIAGSVLVEQDTLNDFALKATPSTVFTGGASLDVLTSASEIRHSYGIVIAVPNTDLFTIQAANTTTITWQRVGASAFDGTKLSVGDRVFTGDARAAAVGDRVWELDNVLGVVTRVSTLTLNGTTYPNALVTISEFALTAGTSKSDWYVTAEGVDANTSRNIDPEAVFSTVAQATVVKANLNRDSSGFVVGGSARLFAEYRALRSDVTASDSDAKMLIFNSTDEVNDIIGPIRTDNPLAFGCYSAFLNAGSIQISALGVDEVSSGSPHGTVAAYNRAFEFLETEEVYGVAVLTHESGVHQTLMQHVNTMSEAENKGERVAIFSVLPPTEKTSTSVVSGIATVADQGGGKYNFTFDDDVNVPSVLAGKFGANGKSVPSSVGATCTAADGIYFRREGDTFNWLVTKIVAANVLQVDTNLAFMPDSGPGTSGNGDAYWRQSAPEDFEVDGETLSVQIRQSAIDGTTSTGKVAQCTALRDLGRAYGSKRMNATCLPLFGIKFDGVEQFVHGFYSCAMYAAMAGEHSPSQSFTKFPLIGPTRPIGTSDTFSEKQMAIAADGGINWFVQDSIGAPLVSRHQLTTDTSSLETQEFSAVRQIDHLSKRLRAAAAIYAGKTNISSSIGLAVTIVLNAQIKIAVARKEIASASITAIEVPVKDSPDSMHIKVEPKLFYPTNRISIAIHV